jgi:hypothetical protein
MTDAEWEVVYTADGKLAAEMIRLTLDSFGIEAVLFEESLGNVYGLTVGPLAQTQVLVHPAKAAEAKEILKAMENGSLEATDDEVSQDAGQDVEAGTENNN